MELAVKDRSTIALILVVLFSFHTMELAVKAITSIGIDTVFRGFHAMELAVKAITSIGIDTVFRGFHAMELAVKGI